MNVKVKIYSTMKIPETVGEHHRILCMTGKHKGFSYFIKEKRVVLGRGDKTDIQVLDSKSSREHAEITLVGEECILTDLGSQNGVLVNDFKISQYTLLDGDKFIIGKTVYRYNHIIVKDEEKDIALLDNNGRESDEEVSSDTEDNEDEKKKKEKKKRIIMILGVLVLALVFLDDGEQGAKKKDKNRETFRPLGNDISKEFSEAAKNKIRREEVATKKECKFFIKNGNRELREENFFRAIEEFEDAREVCVNGDADYKLNRARQLLDDFIITIKSKAALESEALKYKGAIVSYCEIVRLLQRYPEDARHQAALKEIEVLEQKLGYEKGEARCFEK